MCDLKLTTCDSRSIAIVTADGQRELILQKWIVACFEINIVIFSLILLVKHSTGRGNGVTTTDYPTPREEVRQARGQLGGWRSLWPHKVQLGGWRGAGEKDPVLGRELP